jgi:hypothetical protein
METLIILPTESTPDIIFDASKNVFEMKGESRPENAKAFYDPVIEWIKDFCAVSIAEKRREKIIFTVFFEYFSSSSAKYLMNILARLEELHKNSVPIDIRWVYHDIDMEMKEAGEEFQKLLSLPFKFEVVAH